MSRIRAIAGTLRVDPQATRDRDIEASRSVSTVRAIRAPSGVFAVMQFMYVFIASIRSAARRRTTSAIPMPDGVSLGLIGEVSDHDALDERRRPVGPV